MRRGQGRVLNHEEIYVKKFNQRIRCQRTGSPTVFDFITAHPHLSAQSSKSIAYVHLPASL